jgi:hypothetical protein
MFQSILILILLVALAYILIKFTSKLIFKLIAFALLLPIVGILLYLFNVGPFAHNYFAKDSLTIKFCNENTMELLEVKACNCIVKPYGSILENKFSAAELQEIEKNNYQSAYIFLKVWPILEKELESCCENNIEKDSVISYFFKSVTPLNLSKNELENWIVNKKDKLINEKETLDRIQQRI